MNYTVIVRSEAEADVEDAYRWYESRSQGLGNQFLLNVREALDIIRHSPRIYPIIREEFRRAPLGRFPFSVIYVVRSDRIEVLAVFHVRRSPLSWLSRL